MLRVLKVATIAFVVLVPGSPTVGETLSDALAIAYNTNPTIRAERARLRATREAKAQAWAGALPQISGQTAFAKTDTTQTALFDPSGPQTIDQQLNTLTAGVSGEQPVFAGFRNFNAVKQAGARIRAGGAQLVAVEQSVLSDVAAAYFNVQRNMTIYDLSKKNIDVLSRQLEMASVRFEVGEITRTDVAQSEARLAEARARLSSVQGDLSIARAEYAQLVGQVPGDLEPVETLPELPESLDAAMTLAREYAPSVIGARENSEAARRQVKIARGALLPTISLTADYQYADEPSFFVQQSEQFAFGARATVPLFSGGANYSRVREAKAQHSATKSQLVEAERLVEAQVTSAWQRLIASRAIIVSAEQSVKANELAFEGVTQEAAYGTRTTLDVLNAEQELLNAQVTLVNARRDAKSAAFSVLAAIGLLTPDAIGVEPMDDLEGIALYER